MIVVKTVIGEEIKIDEPSDFFVCSHQNFTLDPCSHDTYLTATCCDCNASWKAYKEGEEWKRVPDY